MLKCKNIFKVISVILGTIIGAGFASGKEIYRFFAQFGVYGILGIFISGGITGLIIFFTIRIGNSNKLDNNDEFIKIIGGNKIIFYIVSIFLIVSFYIMITGFSSFFKQEFKIPIWFTSTIIAALLYLVFINKIEGVVKINIILAPILIFIIIITILKNDLEFCIKIPTQIDMVKAIINGILYSSYNSIVLIPIIITLRKYVKTNKQNIFISLISAIFIIIISLGIFGMLIKNDNIIKNIEFPIVNILKDKYQKIFYSFAVEGAIFTSAVSAGYGILENIKQSKKIVACLCFLGIPISYIGFGNMVNYLYPVFGVLGLMEIILIFKIVLQKNAKTGIL